MRFLFFLRPILPLALLLAALAARAQGVGIGTPTPDPSAALDVASGTKGLLLPRVLITADVANPATGLLVYQVSTPAGFYYNAGTPASPSWQLLTTGSNGFIRNQATPQAGASFNVAGSGTVGGTLTAQNAVVTNALTGSGSDLGAVVGLGIRADGGLNLGQNTDQNLFIGYAAGESVTPIANSPEGRFNVFVGRSTGKNTTKGSSNSFYGSNTGPYNTTGNCNVFVGTNSGFDNTTGGGNTFSGCQSGSSNFDGSENTFTGFLAGFSNFHGTSNTFSGSSAGYSNSGSYNVFLGAQSGYNNSTGSNNTALGYNSGPASGSGNLTNATALGANVTLTQSNTVVLGNGANVGIGTSAPSQKLEVTGTVFAHGESTGFVVDEQASARVGLLKYPGHEGGIWRTSSQKFEIGRVDAGVAALPGTPSTYTTDLLVSGTGDVGIGTAPGAKLHVAGAMKIDGTNALEFGAGVSGKENSAGKIGYGTFTTATLDIVGAGTNTSNRKIKFWAEGGATFTGSVTGVGAYNSSDARLKQDIRPLTGALALVAQLHGRRYRWNALGVQRGGQAGAEQVGVLAQELEAVLPELVSTGPDGYKAVNYAQLTPVLLEAVKELKASNDALQAHVAQAEADHALLLSLQAQLARLAGAAEARSQK